MNAKVVWSWRSAALAIVVLFAVTRLYNLTLLPLAGSEATPITWALQAQQARDWSDWFAAVRAAAQPLHSWLLALVISLVSSCADQACYPDRVLAARLLSVGSGAATLALVFVLTTRLFGRAAACAAALVYVCAPLTLLHDRLALPSALLTAASLLALWRLLAWCEQPDMTGRSRTTLWRSVVRLWLLTWRSGALGIALAMALLTSMQALALLFVVPGVALIWRPASLRRWWSLANAFLLAGLLFSVVFTDPSAGAGGGVVAVPPSAQPAAAGVATDWTANARSLAASARTYLTWPFIALLGGVLVAAGAAGLRRGLATFTERRWWRAAHTKQSDAGSRVARTNDGSTWRGLGVCLLWSAGSAVGVLRSEPAPTTADLVFVVVPAFPLVGWGLARLTAASQRLPELVSALVKRAPAPAGRQLRRVVAGIVLGVCVAPGSSGTGRCSPIRRAWPGTTAPGFRTVPGTSRGGSPATAFVRSWIGCGRRPSIDKLLSSLRTLPVCRATVCVSCWATCRVRCWPRCRRGCLSPSGSRSVWGVRIRPPALELRCSICSTTTAAAPATGSSAGPTPALVWYSVS